jgi:hypothetical protein
MGGLYQHGESGSRALEQPGIVDQLLQSGTGNPDRIDLESAIPQMIEHRKSGSRRHPDERASKVAG